MSTQLRSYNPILDETLVSSSDPLPVKIVQAKLAAQVSWDIYYELLEYRLSQEQWLDDEQIADLTCAETMAYQAWKDSDDYLLDLFDAYRKQNKPIQSKE